MPSRGLLVALFCCWPTLAAHAALLEVDAVVSPAWIAHEDGTREPVEIGAAVVQGDRLITGPGARVRLHMEAVSAVKLGENAVFAVERLTATQRPDETMYRAGTFDAVRGAFRCTAPLVQKAGGERDLEFRMRRVAVGIRGTADVLGQSDATQDLVVLIEGGVAVSGPGGETVLARPRAAYVAARDGPVPPVRRISENALKGLAAETEVFAGTGGARRGGRSRVEAMATIDETYARGEHGRLREAGYPAQLNVVEEEGAMPLYRVDLTQIVGERDARALVQKLKTLGYPAARATR